jgi:hypothetical protein
LVNIELPIIAKPEAIPRRFLIDAAPGKDKLLIYLVAVVGLPSLGMVRVAFEIPGEFVEHIRHRLLEKHASLNEDVFKGRFDVLLRKRDIAVSLLIGSP